jgi:hypothetical protein
VFGLTEERSEGSAVQESLLDVTSICARVLAGLPNQLVDNVEKRGASKGEETPLVTASDERSNKTSDDHDLVDKDGEEDSRPRHASSEHQIKKEQRCRNEPVNVADIVDRTVVSSDLRIIAMEFDSDGCEAEVGSHGEVGDAGDKHNGGGDVVKDPVTTLLAHAEADEGDTSDWNMVSMAIVSLVDVPNTYNPLPRRWRSRSLSHGR